MTRLTQPEVIGAGPDAMLLPALSAISTRDEMRALAERLGGRLRCHLSDWPGYGSAPASDRLSPALLDSFLDTLLDTLPSNGLTGIAAGHGATYLARAARRHAGRFARLVLIAPTWRGPLPTMTRGARPELCRLVRSALESPVAGPLLYRLNVSKPVIGMMMREHVFADSARVTPSLVAAKQQVALRQRGRFGTAAFVSGGVDPAATREEFLTLFDGPLPPILVLRPRRSPRRSAAEMDALAATGRVEVALIDGALAACEEHPEQAAASIDAWMGGIAAGEG